uniref:UvrD-like helicase ATP-binding domain-containing protein n=1 Tax=Plectus sambesii TaxID=2011161 RepID=A0A914WDS8_9BILA
MKTTEIGLMAITEARPGVAFYGRVDSDMDDKNVGVAAVEEALQVVRLKCLQDLKDVRTTDVRMLHDGYMKLYQLENPVRRACGNTYDAILINEAQDMNPAILDVISKQTQSPRMFVGDPNQQIYSFRGTTNAFEEIKETITSTFYLTQIFRFGPDIAFIDNCWLDIVKGESRKMLIGCEKKSRIIDFCPHMALHSRFIPFAGLRTIKRRCKMIAGTGSIQLSTPPGRPRTAHSWENIQKVKSWLQRKRHLSVQKLASELDISYGSIRRILKDDLLLRPYKKTIEPLLTDAHKDKRKKFFNWVRSNFRKEDTMRILFSDEKMFDIDGMYNSQNDRIWAANRAEADERGGKKQRRKFPTKVMVWLGACSKGVTPLVIFEKGTVDHARYIKEVLPMALRYGNKVYGNNWTYQQDGARPHSPAITGMMSRQFPFFPGQGILATK